VALPPTRDGHNFEFTLNLKESAGLAARITYLSIDGVNYSTRIKELLGTGELAAGSSLSAPVSAYLKPSMDFRTIELRGFTPKTGQPWSAKVLTRWLPQQQ